MNVGGFGGGETNKGISFVTLLDRDKRTQTQQEIMDSVRTKIEKEIPKDFKATLINPSGSFGGGQTRHYHRAQRALAAITPS